MKKDSVSVKYDKALWLHRIIRFAFALLFFFVGFVYYEEGGWPALLLGLVFLITAFFAPRRCNGNNDSCAV